MNKYNGMKRAGYWLGKKVRLVRDVGNGIGRWPKGTVATVTDVGVSMRLISDPCPHCGAKLYITKLSYFDFELLSEDSKVE